ncbi:MAG: DUF1674 domain-containing protein [Pseudobdellovibrionaceae bacterium]
MQKETPIPPKSPVKPVASEAAPQHVPNAPLPPEYGGRKGPEATRFGDWEMNGKCVDF